MKAYKGFNKDMTCRGFQYEVGKEYECEGEVALCEKGFHACENPLDVLDFYGDIDNRFCEVEQSGDMKGDDKKTVSSKIKITAEIGFVGLFKAGIEWLKEVTKQSNDTNDKGDYAQIGSSEDYAKIGSSGYYAKIGSSGYYAQIGSSGYYAQIGSSGDYAQINSTGEDAVVMCAGNGSCAKAKKGSWITLSEWRYADYKKRYVPICVKTERVDGERIKADTWYRLINGEFQECE